MQETVNREKSLKNRKADVPNSQIENIITSVNQGMSNSGVLIRVHLHCIERYVGLEYSDDGAKWDDKHAMLSHTICLL